MNHWKTNALELWGLIVHVVGKKFKRHFQAFGKTWVYSDTSVILNFKTKICKKITSYFALRSQKVFNIYFRQTSSKWVSLFNWALFSFPHYEWAVNSRAESDSSLYSFRLSLVKLQNMEEWTFFSLMFYNCAVLDITALNPVIFIIVSGGGVGGFLFFFFFLLWAM